MNFSRNDRHFMLQIMQATIESSSEGVLILDHDTNAILSYNKKFVEIFNLKPKEVERRDSLEYVGGQLENPSEFQELQSFIKKFPYQEFSQELSLNEQAGFKVVDSRTCPVIIQRNGLDIIVGRVWYFRDITQERETETRMIESAKMAALGELASGIAHEINNPMTTIKNYSKRISKFVGRLDQKQECPLEKLEKAATAINSSTDRIINIVSGLRNISLNEEIVDYETTNLSEILSDVKELSRERVNKYNIQLDITIESHIFIHCNRVQIYQVVVNLVNNAIDAIVDSGVDHKWINIVQSLEEGQVVIAVQDSGPGVDQKTVEKIFNPFFTTKNAEKGTGLGLSLSKSIMENHNGELCYEEDEGTSTFKAILPMAS